MHTVKDGRDKPHLGDDSTDIRFDEIPMIHKEICFEDYFVELVDKDSRCHLSEEERESLRHSMANVKRILAKNCSVDDAVSTLKQIIERV